MRSVLLPLLLCGFAGSAVALEPDVLFEKLSPSVWAVIAHDTEGVRMNSGSGVVVDREQLVTSCSVLRKAKSISIKRQNIAYGAQLLHADTERDLCLLRATSLAAPIVKTAPAKALRVGQKALAITASAGTDLLLSDGMLTSIAVGDMGEPVSMQLSFPFAPASAGGAVFDRDGRLFGIVSPVAARAASGAVAVPADWIAEVPKRAERALETLRLAEVVKASKPDNKAVNESPVAGAEFVEHFTKFGSVQAVSNGNGNYKLELTWGKGFSLTNLDNRNRASGVYSLKEASGQICLNPSVPPNSRWALWKDCYRLVSLGDKRFILRAVSDEHTLTYSKN